MREELAGAQARLAALEKVRKGRPPGLAACRAVLQSVRKREWLWPVLAAAAVGLAVYVVARLGLGGRRRRLVAGAARCCLPAHCRDEPADRVAPMSSAASRDRRRASPPRSSDRIAVRGPCASWVKISATRLAHRSAASPRPTARWGSSANVRRSPTPTPPGRPDMPPRSRPYFDGFTDCPNRHDRGGRRCASQQSVPMAGSAFPGCRLVLVEPAEDRPTSDSTVPVVLARLGVERFREYAARRDVRVHPAVQRSRSRSNRGPPRLSGTAVPVSTRSTGT